MNNEIRPINIDTITGKSPQGLVALESGCLVHAGMLDDLQALQQAAAAQGFDLQVVSGFRDWGRQLAIWQGKFTGERDLLDVNGNKLDVGQLSEQEIVQAIMRFSAIPGGSRHHWGTDIDVYDAAAVPQDYRLQLIEAEYLSGGVFYEMTVWLDEQIAAGDSFGFFRPYSKARSSCKGIANEPWHLSYAPIASEFQQALTQRLWCQVLEQQDIAGKNSLLSAAERLYQDYIAVPADLYPAPWAERLC